MRKTQVALAALALVASTAALADVAVYGALDVAVVSNSTGTALAGAGNSNTSLIGFKGSEDIGGLKAAFNLETGLTGATGQLGNGGVLQSTSLFNRNANVSLSTENVGLTIGTQISPFILAGLNGTTAVGGNGAFVPALARLDGGSLAAISTDYSTNQKGIDTKTGGFFIPNAASISVSGGGISASALYRLRGQGANTDGSEYTAASVSGSVAGISLALGYQDAKNVGTGTTASPTAPVNAQSVIVSGNTTIAGIRLNAAYGDNRGTTKSTGYILGASMPLMGALSGGITFADNAKVTALGRQTTLSLQYDLSKATYTYLNYSTFGVANKGAGASNDDGGLGSAKSLLAVGLSHSF